MTTHEVTSILSPHFPLGVRVDQMGPNYRVAVCHVWTPRGLAVVRASFEDTEAPPAIREGLYQYILSQHDFHGEYVH